LAARLRPLAPPPDPYPLNGHPELPTVLLYATHDEIFEPEWERYMAREVLGVEPVELDSGHFPMVEDPEALADVLQRLALTHRTGRKAVDEEE
jgi:pimeloyl-ACP methyl ester carboxylesterase